VKKTIKFTKYIESRPIIIVPGNVYNNPIAFV